MQQQQHEAFFSFTVPANHHHPNGTSLSGPELPSDDQRLSPVALEHESVDHHTTSHPNSQANQNTTTILTESEVNVNQPNLNRSGSGSISPQELICPSKPSHDRFRFSFSTGSHHELEESQTSGLGTEDVSPVPSTPAGLTHSSHTHDQVTPRRDSRPGLSIVTQPKSDLRHSFSGPTAPTPLTLNDSNRQTESQPTHYSHHEISTHNTRPMTAPGAGWAGGSYNHGYDYSSASAGLFGDGGYHHPSGRATIEDDDPIHHSHHHHHHHHHKTNLEKTHHQEDEEDGTKNPISIQTSSALLPPHTPSSHPSKPKLQSLLTSKPTEEVRDPSSDHLPSTTHSSDHQARSSLISSHLTTTPDRPPEPSGRSEDPMIYPSASPTLPPVSLPLSQATSASPYLHPSSSHHPFQNVRPNTHAGTSASFGERPSSSYGPLTPLQTGPPSPYTLASYSTSSRPGTANASASSPIFAYHPGRPSTSYGTPRLGIPNLATPSIYGTLDPHPQSQLSQSSNLHSSHSLSSPYGNSHHLSSHPTQIGSSGAVEGPDQMYSFNTLPGVPRKRARRRYDEIERLYSCSYPGCTKAYGTLNHLNAHITMQKHGPKRLPQEFKEIRKEWRARKKAEAEARSAPYKPQPLTSSHPHPHPHPPSHPPPTHFSTSHPNHRVLSSPTTNPNLHPAHRSPNPMMMMGSGSGGYPHLGHPPRSHPLLHGSNPNPHLLNLQMGRVMSSGATLETSPAPSGLSHHPHYAGDLLGPLPASAPAYYASSHYPPPPLAHYGPSAPRPPIRNSSLDRAQDLDRRLSGPGLPSSLPRSHHPLSTRHLHASVPHPNTPNDEKRGNTHYLVPATR